jgi:hypothetical protein
MPNPIEMLLRSLGVSPEMLHQSFKVVQDAAARFERIEGALQRIETNTLLILEAGGDTAPAAPSRYDIFPMLPSLPPFDERKAA